MRVRTVFDKVARTFVKSVRCTYCKGPVRKQRTFFQTINPFNVHAFTKQPKDSAQIGLELQELGAAWQRQPELCPDCEEHAEEGAA